MPSRAALQVHTKRKSLVCTLKVDLVDFPSYPNPGSSLLTTANDFDQVDRDDALCSPGLIGIPQVELVRKRACQNPKRSGRDIHSGIAGHFTYPLFPFVRDHTLVPLLIILIIRPTTRSVTRSRSCPRSSTSPGPEGSSSIASPRLHLIPYARAP
jgi:hypothetical protein